jgi:hypothetical protein
MKRICAHFEERYKYAFRTEAVFEKDGKYYWFYIAGGTGKEWLELHISRFPPDGQKLCYLQKSRGKLYWDDDTVKYYKRDLSADEVRQIKLNLFSLNPTPDTVMAMMVL